MCHIYAGRGMFNIILFGPPGSGKGTQSARIARDFDFVHLSTGQILRNLIAHNTLTGKLVKKYIDRGYLVPDDIVLRELFREAMEHSEGRGLIFDGFPRTVYQANIFDRLLEKKEIPVAMVISLKVTDDELFRRIISRAKDSGRSDDREEIIFKRINTYETETKPLIEYYRGNGRLVEISGMASVEKVYGEIKNSIDAAMHRINRGQDENR